MVDLILSDDRIEAGEALIQQLDDADVKVDAALWLYSSDTERWKLVLSLPEIISLGPKAAYSEVQKGLTQLSNGRRISLNDVVVARPQEPMLKLLRKVVRTGPGISRLRFTGNVVDGQMIDDALIYRL